MSKINSQELFQLIKSLSQSEKRYFKREAAKHSIQGENKYVTLFDSIVSQEEYDEDDILKEEKRFGKKQLPDLKNYLYPLILRSLLSYHSGSTVNAQLKDAIRQIEILYQKGLYSQCRKLVVRTKSLAVSAERHIDLLSLLYWEKRLLDAISYSGTAEKDLLRIHREEKLALNIIQNNNDFWFSYARIFRSNIVKGHLHSHSELKKLQTILNSSQFRYKTQAHSYWTKTYYYFAREYYYYVHQNWNCFYRESKKHVRWMESLDEGILQEEVNPYIGALYNLVRACSYLRKYAEALDEIQKLRALKTYSIYSQIRVFSRSYMLELELYAHTGEFEKGLEIMNDIQEGLLRFKNKMNKEHEYILWYDIFYNYFGAGYYSKALFWLNKILNEGSLDSREDIQCVARIMNLILHYEIGNLEMLEYSILSYKRFLSKRHRFYWFEKMVLGFIKQLIRSDKPTSRNAIFQSFTKQLSRIVQDPTMQTAFAYFDFKSWVQSKIQNRPFAEVRREQVKMIYGK